MYLYLINQAYGRSNILHEWYFSHATMFIGGTVRVVKNEDYISYSLSLATGSLSLVGNWSSGNIRKLVHRHSEALTVDVTVNMLVPSLSEVIPAKETPNVGSKQLDCPISLPHFKWRQSEMAIAFQKVPWRDEVVASAFARPMKIRARLFLFYKAIKCFAFLFTFCFHVYFSRSFESRCSSAEWFWGKSLADLPSWRTMKCKLLL